MITPGSVAFYRTFGFLALHQAFDSEEVAEISRRFDARMDRDRDGQPFTGTERHAISQMVEQDPYLTRIAEDDRIYGTVEKLLGEGFCWLCSEGNMYVGDTHWHPDGGSNPDFAFMKVSMYLDPLTQDNGCLRVIPGSHRPPLFNELRNLANRHGAQDAERTGTGIDIPGTEVPCVPLETQPGDVFFLNMNMWHAAFGGIPGRRHLVFDFSPKPTNADETAILKQHHAKAVKLFERWQVRRPGRLFTDTFLNSASPRIQSMVAKWKEFGCE